MAAYASEADPSSGPTRQNVPVVVGRAEHPQHGHAEFHSHHQQHHQQQDFAGNHTHHHQPHHQYATAASSTMHGVPPPPGAANFTSTQPAQSPAEQAMYDAQGNVLPPPMAFALGQQWQTGLFHCMDDSKECVDATFCPYCHLGYMYHRTRRNYVDMDALVCVAACCGDMFSGFGCLMLTACMRHRIVERYRIDEGVGWLLVRSFCCAPCTVCQMHREMTLRGEAPGGVCLENPMAPPNATQGMGTRGAADHATSLGAPRSLAASSSHQGRPPAQNPYVVSTGSAAAGSAAQNYYSPNSILAPRHAPVSVQEFGALGPASSHTGRTSDSDHTPQAGSPLYPDTPASVVGTENTPMTPQHGPVVGGAGGHGVIPSSSTSRKSVSSGGVHAYHT